MPRWRWVQDCAAWAARCSFLLGVHLLMPGRDAGRRWLQWHRSQAELRCTRRAPDRLQCTGTARLRRHRSPAEGGRQVPGLLQGSGVGMVGLLGRRRERAGQRCRRGLGERSSQASILDGHLLQLSNCRKLPLQARTQGCNELKVLQAGPLVIILLGSWEGWSPSICSRRLAIAVTHQGSWGAAACATWKRRLRSASCALSASPFWASARRRSLSCPSRAACDSRRPTSSARSASATLRSLQPQPPDLACLHQCGAAVKALPWRLSSMLVILASKIHLRNNLHHCRQCRHHHNTRCWGTPAHRLQAGDVLGVCFAIRQALLHRHAACRADRLRRHWLPARMLLPCQLCLLLLRPARKSCRLPPWSGPLLGCAHTGRSALCKGLSE